MIRYALKCSDAHAFESWFASSRAFDALLDAGRITCPVCGDADIAKAVMAPEVRASRGRAEAPAPRPLDVPGSKAEVALAALRRKIEATSDYVGLSFATEARAMHEGEMPHRSIYGEANAGDARRLLEDGVPVAPLPFIPPRRTN